MDSLERLNEALAYIEENLEENINYTEIARIACCSEFHFKRMFSFLAGITLSDYIRRRRLTQAAFDLRSANVKVLDTALKYGYSSPDAFTRAFQNLHGMTPTEARKNGLSLKAYPRMTFQLTVKGAGEMNYRIETKEAFRVAGVMKRITLVYSGTNPDIAEMWQTIGEETVKRIEQLSDLQPSGIINVCSNFSEGREDNGELDYYIAAATTKPCPDDFQELEVEASAWAVFEVSGDWEKVQEAWGRIYAEWFPSSGFELNKGPEIMSSADNFSEIWIPVKKK
ncbi:AraC family transcriptional regulator [Alteribacter lacisalsi]|jgi:AraC family transcriptional regulator|uniref:AraC family transcriptional regulator n=1 Tax=Alteribacter lacisalsi TaxID=2045244 RepID=A0A2W0H810_9BACI|nr:AraC family transcriptional regulator [Alteribacter lacisalsi]PYZ96886.1 AraC family transcriptional regulator [Alteribacter lacisalsi]